METTSDVINAQRDIQRALKQGKEDAQKLTDTNSKMLQRLKVTELQLFSSAPDQKADFNRLRRLAAQKLAQKLPVVRKTPQNSCIMTNINRSDIQLDNVEKYATDNCTRTTWAACKPKTRDIKIRKLDGTDETKLAWFRNGNCLGEITLTGKDIRKAYQAALQLRTDKYDAVTLGGYIKPDDDSRAVFVMLRGQRSDKASKTITLQIPESSDEPNTHTHIVTFFSTYLKHKNNKFDPTVGDIESFKSFETVGTVAAYATVPPNPPSSASQRIWTQRNNIYWRKLKDSEENRDSAGNYSISIDGASYEFRYMQFNNAWYAAKEADQSFFTADPDFTDNIYQLRYGRWWYYHGGISWTTWDAESAKVEFLDCLDEDFLRPWGEFNWYNAQRFKMPPPPQRFHVGEIPSSAFYSISKEFNVPHWMAIILTEETLEKPIVWHYLNRKWWTYCENTPEFMERIQHYNFPRDTPPGKKYWLARHFTTWIALPAIENSLPDVENQTGAFIFNKTDQNWLAEVEERDEASRGGNEAGGEGEEAGRGGEEAGRGEDEAGGEEAGRKGENIWEELVLNYARNVGTANLSKRDLCNILLIKDCRATVIVQDGPLEHALNKWNDRLSLNTPASLDGAREHAVREHAEGVRAITNAANELSEENLKIKRDKRSAQDRERDSVKQATQDRRQARLRLNGTYAAG